MWGLYLALGRKAQHGVEPWLLPSHTGELRALPPYEVAAEFHPSLQMKEQRLRVEYCSPCRPIRKGQGKYLKLGVLCPAIQRWCVDLGGDLGACHTESCLSPLPGGHSNSEHQQLQGSPAGGDTHKLRGQAPSCQLACMMEEKKSLILVPEVNPVKGRHSLGRDVASPQPLSV